MSSKPPFDAIVVTSASASQAAAYLLELELRQAMGAIPPKTLVIAVPDPAGVRIGSGGATLNALAVVSQRLCTRAGFNYLNMEFLATCRILILHSGGDSQRIPICSVRGKAFCSLPSSASPSAPRHMHAALLARGNSANIALNHDGTPASPFLGPTFALPPSSVPTERKSDAPSVAAADVHPDVKIGGSHLNAPVDFLIQRLSSVCDNAPAPGGVLITSTDVLMIIPDEYRWAEGRHSGGGAGGVVGFGIAASPETGTHHGVYVLDDRGEVKDILQKASLAELKKQGAIRSDGTVLLDSGIVFLSSQAARDLLNLSWVAPLSSCTSHGLDLGPAPVRFELYTDMLLPMNPSITYEQFLATPLPDRFSNPDDVKKARNLLWKTFNPHSFVVVSQPGAHFAHLGTIPEYIDLLNHDSIFRKPFGLRQRAKAVIEHPQLVESAVVLNSVLTGRGTVKTGAVLEHCRLWGGFRIGSGALCSGVRSVPGLEALDRIVVQETQLNNERVAADLLFSSVLRQQTGGTSATSSVPLSSSSSSRSAIGGTTTTRLWVLAVYGTHDQIKLGYKHRDATLCGRAWSHFFTRTAALADLETDIWPQPGLADSHKTIWNARLFPIIRDDEQPNALWLQDGDLVPSISILRRWRASVRVSLEDLLAMSDASQEFHWRNSIAAEGDRLRVEKILVTRANKSVAPMIGRCLPVHRQALLNCLDAIAADSPLDVAARTLCTIADVIGNYPGASQYSRNGPARNPSWRRALELLALPGRDNQREAIRLLAVQRRVWLASPADHPDQLHDPSPDLAMRVARHYDAAWQVLVKRASETVRIATKDGVPIISYKPHVDGIPSAGHWSDVVCPARLDLCGGWSDTPPVTFEHGGKVVNVAVRINGGYPLGASARAYTRDTAAPVLTFRTTQTARVKGETKAASDSKEDVVTCRTLTDLADYCDPLAPAALVKCVLLAMGIVDLTSSVALADQVHAATARTGAAASDGIRGLEIRSYCLLPQGTGLGVSSILASTLIAAVARAVGRVYSHDAVVHLTLLVEQMLTTGGGWQDQVGGIYPGFKFTRSESSLPLVISPSIIGVEEAIIKKFDAHSILIHTGSSRLARGLLQTVIRRWYQRGKDISTLVDNLCIAAEDIRAAIIRGDISEIGRLLELFWTQKKIMAAPPSSHAYFTSRSSKQKLLEPLVEPVHVQQLSAAMRPYVHGLSLCGAGGGGFMICITKQPVNVCRPKIQASLDALNSERRRLQAAARGDAEAAGGRDDEHGDFVLYTPTVCNSGMDVSVSAT